MSTLSMSDPALLSTLRTCVSALQRLATYELPPPLDQRMRALGEAKEYLTEAEHEELLALVDLAQHRTVEKLEAQRALRTLRQVISDVCQTP